MAILNPDEVVVYWLDIALLCVLAAFFLAALPRTFARLLQPRSWTRGHILYRGRTQTPPAPRRSTSRGRNAYRTDTNVEMDFVTEQSHTLVAHSQNGALAKQAAYEIDHSKSAPVHVPTLFSVFYPATAWLSYSFTRTATTGKLVLLVLLVAAVFIVTFVNGGEPFESSTRLGFIATSLIPFAVELGTKNNIFGILVGMGYERLNFLHRWLGVMIFVVANLHAILYVHEWILNGVFSITSQLEFVKYGAVALIGVELLYFGSISYVRNRAYKLFLFTHIIGIALFLSCLPFHQAATKYFVLSAFAVYALDHLVRLVKTRIATARISSIPELGMTKVVIPSLTAGWRAGQHVRLRVFSAELGILGWTVAHPFTVANASNRSGLTLLVKKAGPWTSKLYDAAGRAGYYSEEPGKEVERNIRVIVEGPYGGLGNTIIASYSSALLIAGGSGVSFVLAAAEELTADLKSQRCSLRFIDIIWITQEESSINPLVPAFNSILAAVGPIPGLIMRITIYYSRASPPSSKNNGPLKSNLAPGLLVKAGRPGMKRGLAELCRMTASVHNPKGIAIGVCGPDELIKDVRRAGRSIDAPTRRSCGGVEIHEEFFGW